MDETATAEARKTVDLLIFQAYERLSAAADLLRGPLTPASPQAMGLEMAVSRALDSLTGAGYPARRA